MAEDLYQDELARGLYDEWLTPLRDQYRQQFGYVLGRLAALSEQQGDFDTAIRHAERLVAQDPLREAHHQLLIRLHVVNHDRAGALRAYHQCMRVLRRELGVDPDPVTRELFQRALKSTTPAAATTPVAPVAAASAAALVGVTTAFYDYFRDFCLQLHLFLETSSQQGHARVGVRIGQWYKLAADCN